MDVVLILGGVVILALLYYTYSIQMSTRNMPPGPFVVPFGMGSLPQIWYAKPIFQFWKARPWEYFSLLSKKYGDIFALSGAGMDSVVLASYDILKEVENMEEYSMKLASEFFTYPRTFGKELGLIFVGSPPLWTEMRKFTVRTLREFGFGKQYTMQSVIAEEASLIADDFQKKIRDERGIVKFRNTFSLTVLNVLWCMVAGKRYEHDDPRLLKLMDNLFRMSKTATFASPVEIIVPIVQKFAPGILAKFKVAARYKTFEETHALSKSLIEERKAEGFYLSNPQNYIDVFLRKIHDNRNEKDTFYTEEQLQAMLADLLAVGTLTLNATLNYAVLFLILNPEMQKKLQAEIDSVIPRTIAPTMEDLENFAMGDRMPYFQAFILETHRCANVVPNPIPRLAPKDWYFRGYRIPKGTFIFSNHFGVNTDPKIWGDPETFRPNRFINSAGEFTPDPRVVAFGFGKRICIGIALVDAILPIFLATLLQKFDLSVVPGQKRPSTEPEIGVSLSPLPFPALITNRL